MNPTPGVAPSVTNLAFLSGLLPNLDPTETWWVCSYVADPNDDDMGKWYGGPATQTHGHFGRSSANSFFAIATIKRGEGNSRRKACVARVFAVPLDDVEGELPLLPTWTIQTSLHKQQAGYRLVEPLTDLALADRLLQELVRSGRIGTVDKGGCNVARYVRLPVGCNTKAGHVAANGGKPFQHRLLTWHPEVAYTPEQLAEAFGLDLTVPVRPKMAPRPNASLDHALLLGLLHEAGLYKRDLGDGRHEITCPWVAEHTGELDNGTVYCAPDENYPAGGFKCQHGHCADRHLRELRLHLGPNVAWGVEGEPQKTNGVAHGTVQAAAAVLGGEPEPTPPPDLDEVERSQEAPAAPKGIPLVRACDVIEREVEWVIPDFLAKGELTDLSGDPGVGKGGICCSWAARVTREQPDASVIFFATEDPLHRVRARLRAEGADLTRVLFLDIGQPNAAPILPGDAAQVEALVVEHKAALLILDPALEFMQADLDSHKQQDVAQFMGPLLGIAMRTGAALLTVRHNNKNAGASALHRASGSIGFTGKVRVALTAAKNHDTGERALAVTKNNLGNDRHTVGYSIVARDGASVITWGEVLEVTADELVNQEPAKKRGPPAEKLEAACDLLRSILSGGKFMQVDDVIRCAKSEGISRTRIYLAASRVGVRKGTLDRRAAWALNPELAVSPSRVSENNSGLGGEEDN